VVKEAVVGEEVYKGVLEVLERALLCNLLL
jgi:hypothetical protein